jgi:hypothetical protein
MRRVAMMAAIGIALCLGCRQPDVLVINDFESPADFDRFSYRCHYWLAPTTKFVTSGAQGLSMEYPPGEYSTVELREIPGDWRGYQWFEMDVWAPDLDGETLMVRMDDRGNVKDFADRFEMAVHLTGEPQHVRVPLDRVRRGDGGRPQDLGRMRRLLFYFQKLDRRVIVYLDGVKLTK